MLMGTDSFRVLIRIVLRAYTMVYTLAALEDDLGAIMSAAEVAHTVKPKQSRAVKTSLGHGETVLAVQCGSGRGGGN